MAERLKSARERRVLTIRGLAEAAGVAVMTIWRIEHGQVTATVMTTRKLATALGVDPAWLRFGDG